MELIEGAPIGEHFNSLKEKNMKFPEDRIWNIFMQVGGKKCSSKKLTCACIQIIVDEI